MQMKLNGGEMRNMTQSTLEEAQINFQSSTWGSSLKVLGAMLVCGSLLTGCVSTEKYEAEKARALNFQRLLAQEEKRTGELNVKYQDAQRQLGSLESQGHDLNTELEALRDQLNRSHDELSRVRDRGTEGNDDLKLSEPSLAEFGLDDLDFKDSDLASFESDLGGDSLDTSLDSISLESDNTIALGGSSHTVAKGETLYRLSKQYGVSVNDLKIWNSLLDNTIHVGQELVVSHP
jgi:chromosome segregation ATPase